LAKCGAQEPIDYNFQIVREWLFNFVPCC